MREAHGCVAEREASGLNAGRGEDIEAEAGADGTDAEQVSGVRDREDAVEMILASDGGQAGSGLFGVDAVGFGDDLVFGDAVGEQVVMADAALGIGGAASGRRG